MIKKLLFTLMFLVTLSVSAQTQTINIDWGRNSNPSAAGDANASRTIEVGDTVTWNWYSTGTHNVFSTSGESISSGFNSTGFTFSHTFMSIGTTDYICQPHPGDMFGTITVVAEGSLSVPTFEDTLTEIKVYPNPASTTLNIDIPSQLEDGVTVEVYNVIGKIVLTKTINQLTSSISISDWNDGVYLMKISSIKDDTSVTKRFVKI